MIHRLLRAATALALSVGLLAGVSVTSAQAVAPVTPRATSYSNNYGDAPGTRALFFRITFGAGGKVKGYTIFNECDDGARIVSQRLRAVDGRIAGTSSFTKPDGTTGRIRLSLRVVDKDLIVGSVRWPTCAGTTVEQLVLGTNPAWQDTSSSPWRAEELHVTAGSVRSRLQTYRDEVGRYPTSLAGAQRIARTRLVTGYTVVDKGASYSLRVSSSRTRVYAKLSAGGWPVLAVR